MSGVVDAMGKGAGLASLVKSQEKIIAKMEEQKTEMLEDYQDKIDLKQQKYNAVLELQTAISDVKAKASVLDDTLHDVFDKKTTVLETQDTGSASDYIKNIRIEDKAALGDLKIAVEQVATKSEMILGAAEDIGFATAGGLGMDGDITLSLAGSDRIVTVTAADTLEQVIGKIQHEINVNGDNFEVFKLSAGADKAFIEIRAKDTGAASTIDISYSVLFANQPVIEQEVEGQDAIIHANGVPISQAGNSFINIVEGVSFDLGLKANTANPANTAYNSLNYNVITIEHDQTYIKNAIIDFGNSLNNLSFFIGKQSQAKSINELKNNDISELENNNGPLHRTTVLTEAMRIWEKFTGNRHNGAGEISSIYELGMDTKKEIKDGIEYNSLYFEDENLFSKTFAERYEQLHRFFVTGAKITPNVANVSEMKYLGSNMDKEIYDPNIAGKDLNASVVFDAGGAISSFKVSTYKGDIEATIIPVSANYYRVEMPKGGILEGMGFTLNTRGATNSTETFTINYSAGIANSIHNDSRYMFSDDGRNGATVTEMDRIKTAVEKYNQESTKQTERFTEIIEKLNQDYQEMMRMDTMAGINLAMIESALGVNQ